MRAAWAMGIAIGIVACHRAPDVETRPARELGEYSYRITATPVYGKFTILADTVTMEAQQHSCRRVDTGVYRPGVHSFRCLDGSAAFNVRVYSGSPSASRWSTVTPVKKTVEICMKYETTPAGQRVCKSSRTEVRTDTVRDGGLLDVTRIASADRP